MYTRPTLNRSSMPAKPPYALITGLNGSSRAAHRLFWLFLPFWYLCSGWGCTWPLQVWMNIVGKIGLYLQNLDKPGSGLLSDWLVECGLLVRHKGCWKWFLPSFSQCLQAQIQTNSSWKSPSSKTCILRLYTTSQETVSIPSLLLCWEFRSFRDHHEG